MPDPLDELRKQVSKIGVQLGAVVLVVRGGLFIL
jgi:hypothetical protein